MKKIIIFLATLLILASCSLPTTDDDRNYGYGYMIGGHHLYYGDFGYIDKPNGTQDEKVERIVVNIIRPRINYVEDKTPTLLEPEELWIRGYADCDGYAIILNNILYTELEIESGMIAYYYIAPTIDSAGRVIDQGGIVNHAAIYIGDRFYSAQTGRRIYPIKIGYKYPPEHIFSGTFGINHLY